MLNPRADHGPDRSLEIVGSYTAASPSREPPIEDALDRAARLVAEAEREGLDDIELGIRLGDMARICFARQAWAAALPPLTRLLALTRAGGEDRAEVATVLSSLGTAHYALGEHREAAQLWEEALRVRESWLVPNHFLIARSVENLADARVAQGRMDEALALLHRALVIWQQTLPLTDPTLRAIRSKIGDLQLLSSQELPGGVAAAAHHAPSVAPSPDAALLTHTNGAVHDDQLRHSPVFDAPAPDTPVLRAPELVAPRIVAQETEALETEALETEAPESEAAALQAPVLESATLDTPLFDAPVFDTSMVDASVADRSVVAASQVATSEVDTIAPDALDSEVLDSEALDSDALVSEAVVSDALVSEAVVSDDAVAEAPVLGATVTDAPMLVAPVLDTRDAPGDDALGEEPAQSKPTRPLVSRSWLELHRSTAFSAPEPPPAPAVEEPSRELFFALEPHQPETAAEPDDVDVLPEPREAELVSDAREAEVTPATHEVHFAPAPLDLSALTAWRSPFVAPVAPVDAVAASPFEVPIPVNAEWDPTVVRKRSPRVPPVPRVAVVGALALGVVLIGAYALRGGASASPGESASLVTIAGARTTGVGRSPSAAPGALVHQTSAGTVARGPARGASSEAGRTRTASRAGEPSGVARAAGAGTLKAMPAAVDAEVASAMRAVESTTVVGSDSAVRQMLYGQALALSVAGGATSSKRSEPTASASRAAAEDPHDMKPAMLAPGGAQPVFPFQLLSENVRGDVVLEVLVDADGHPDVKTARVVHSTHPLFTASVMRALPTMRFIPAEAHGQKVAQQIEVPFRFDRKAAGGQ